MTIGQTLDNISREIKQCGTDLMDGTCWNNLKGMSKGKQFETALKVGAIAFAVGLTLGLLTGSSIVGVLFAGVATIAAISYFTNSNQNGIAEKTVDVVQNGVNSVKQKVKKQIGNDNELNKFVDNASKEANRILDNANNFINSTFK